MHFPGYALKTTFYFKQVVVVGFKADSFTRVGWLVVGSKVDCIAMDLGLWEECPPWVGGGF